MLHDLVDCVGRNRRARVQCSVDVKRSEQGTARFLAVARLSATVVEEAARCRVWRHEARLAGYAEMRDATALMLEVPDGKLAELVSADRVIQQCADDGAITLPLESILFGSVEQHPRLVVANRRRLPS